MKKIISAVSILLVIILSLGFAACSDEAEAPDGYKLISGDDVAYRFYVPTSWSENTGASRNSAYYSTSDRSLVVVTFYAPDAGQTSIGEFWSYVENLYKTTYTEYAFVESAATTLGGVNAMSYTFTANIGGTSYKVMQVIAPHGNYFYMFTYTAEPGNFDLHIAEVNGMLGVFEFR
jgi:hypothetical protein